MKWIFLYLVIIVSSVANAQYQMAGRILADGEPVMGATIYSSIDDSGSVAGADGSFTLDLTTATQQLEVRAIGYKSQLISVDFANSSHQRLTITLEPSSLGLQEVVVTGTMQPTYVTNSPVKVEVITSDYLATFTPAAASSIVEGIKLLNGVQEVTACGVCFTNSISINGLPGPYTAVLMDGAPIYGNLASVYGLNGIPSMIIDRFEVIKGPSSTLYGSEAVAGVINIITKNPQDQPTLSVDIMGTSHLESFGNVAGTIKGKKVNGYIGLNYAYINDFDDENDDGFSDNVNMDRYSIFSKWQFNRASAKPWTLAAKLYYEDRRNGVEDYLTDRRYRVLRGSDEVYGESIYTHRAEVFGSYAFNTSENIKVDYSFSAHRQDSYYGADHYQAEQDIAFANVIWQKGYGEHALTAGLTQRLQTYNDNTVATMSISGSDQRDVQYIPGIFAQDEWKAGKKLTLLPGVRVDHYQAHGAIFSPRFNIKYAIGPWTNLRLNTGTGFRVVNLFTEDHAFVSGQRSVEIAEELKPESSYNASVNLNHVFAVGPSQGMIDFDVFYTYFTNKIVPDYDTPGSIVYANSAGNAVSKGVGVTVSHEFGFPLRYSLGVNVQRATLQEPDENGALQQQPIEFAQEHSAVFTLAYDIKRWQSTLSFTSRYTGPMALPEVYDLDDAGNVLDESRPVRSSPFVIHTMQFTKQINKQWSMYAGVQNLFDYRQQESPLIGYNDPSAPVGFSDNFDTSYTYAPLHGRELYIGANWKLR